MPTKYMYLVLIFIDNFGFQGQRTVYRLTLVKDFNVAELENYAQLVELGDPDFIEIKVNFISLLL